MFVREVQVPTANEVRSEISALYKAAAQRDFERAASLLGSLSQGALALFEEPPLALEIKANSQCAVAKTSRAERVRSRKTRQSARPLPSPSELRDDASRDQACATIEGLCRIGGQLVEGRRRPLGKRSRANFRPHLFAPSASRHFPKRDAERRFRVGVFRLRGVKQLAKIPSNSASCRRRSRYWPFCKARPRVPASGWGEVCGPRGTDKRNGCVSRAPRR